MSESKEERLKSLLDGCEVVTIDIINTHRASENETRSQSIHLVSGIPENDIIITKLRNSLC